MAGPTMPLRRDLAFVYRLRVREEQVAAFAVRLDPTTLGLVPRRRDSYPDWTALEHRRCASCPLDPATHPRCPVASNLVDVIDDLGDATSYDRVQVEVVAPQRTYLKATSFQGALRSLLGIIMVTSGCPILDQLRPLVRMHVPFASEDETFIRAVSIHLLAQFLRERRGLSADWALEKLPAIYEAVRDVNKDFAKRIAGTGVNDAVLNAVGQLDLFAGLTAHEGMREQMLDRIERLFSAYLEEE